MTLADLVRDILRGSEDYVGVEVVQVHPNHSYVIDTETAQRERRAFAQEVAKIPNIESGLSWKLIAPYVEGNGSLAMAVIAIGVHLGLWILFPNPTTAAELYAQRASMLPQSGVITDWPRWSGVTQTGDSEPRVLREEAAHPQAQPPEPEGLQRLLRQFQR